MFEVDFLYIFIFLTATKKDLTVLVPIIFLFQRHTYFLMHGIHGTSTKQVIFIHLLGKKGNMFFKLK